MYRATSITSFMLPEQGGVGEGGKADIISQTHAGIEFALRRRRIAKQPRHAFSELGEVALEASVGLFLRPDRTLLDIRPGRAPADRPRVAVGAARVGISVQLAGFEAVDERDALGAGLEARRLPSRKEVRHLVE